MNHWKRRISRDLKGGLRMWFSGKAHALLVGSIPETAKNIYNFFFLNGKQAIGKRSNVRPIRYYRGNFCLFHVTNSSSILGTTKAQVRSRWHHRIQVAPHSSLWTVGLLGRELLEWSLGCLSTTWKDPLPPPTYTQKRKSNGNYKDESFAYKSESGWAPLTGLAEITLLLSLFLK